MTAPIPDESDPSESAAAGSALGRSLVLAYGVAIYVFFLGTFLYAAGFVSDLLVPKGVSDGTPVPLGDALPVDLALLGLFGVQHTIMARPWFKARFARVLPQAIERSTFVLCTNLILCLTFWQWRPVEGVAWDLGDGLLATALHAVSVGGWLLVLWSTFLIDHFDLFGLRQVTRHFRRLPHADPAFVERWIYRVVRHPLMLGFMLAFWATPVMSSSRLLFCAVTTAYVMVGLRIEERTLVHMHGEEYEDYRRRVPGLIPWKLGR